MSRSENLRKVLLVSSPRSGSTFAANLIRSSPDVTYLNEIITRERFLLPGFTVARQAGADGATMRAAFEREVESLHAYTLPHGRNLVHRSRFLKFVAFGALKTASSLTARIGLRGFEHNPFYRFYYLNGLHEPFLRPFWEIQFPKNPSGRVLLMKEVSLLRAYRSFRSMYPDGKIIFLVRDPYRQVASERKHHGLSHGEEREPGTPEEIRRAQRRREKGLSQMLDIYGDNDLIREHYGRSFEQTFSLFWRLENDALEESMEQESPERFMNLKYEDLVKDPRRAVEDMLDFLELEVSDGLERYLAILSSFRGRQKHGRSTFVPPDAAAQTSRAILKKERVARVAEVVRGSPAARRFGYE